MGDGLENNLGSGGNKNSVAGFVRDLVHDFPRRVIKPPIDSLETLTGLYYGLPMHGTYETLRRSMTSVSNALRRLVPFYGRDGTADSVATVEHEGHATNLVGAPLEPRVWQPHNYQKPDNLKRLYLEVDNVLNLAMKTDGYDGFRLGNQIKRRTENGSQLVGLLDPSTGIIATTDENLYSAVVRAIESLNSSGLNYRTIGIQFKKQSK